MILPRGGHAMLTGTRKVVLAGEWHLLPAPPEEKPQSNPRKRPRR